jgi:hypothetical protein
MVAWVVLRVWVYGRWRWRPRNSSPRLRLCQGTRVLQFFIWAYDRWTRIRTQCESTYSYHQGESCSNNPSSSRCWGPVCVNQPQNFVIRAITINSETPLTKRKSRDCGSTPEAWLVSQTDTCDRPYKGHSSSLRISSIPTQRHPPISRGPASRSRLVSPSFSPSIAPLPSTPPLYPILSPSLRPLRSQLPL